MTGQVEVALQQLLIFLPPNGIIGYVGGLRWFAEFAKGNGARMLFPRGKMLMLMDARIGYILARIVNDGVALKIIFCVDTLEGDRPISQTSQGIAEISIDRPGVKDVFKPAAGVAGETLVQLYFDLGVI